MMSDEARKTMPQGDDVRDYVIIPDAEWINANAAMMLQRWNEWIR